MRTLPACLFAVCLLHSALLAAVLIPGSAVSPPEPAASPVTIALIPPQAPVLQANAPKAPPLMAPDPEPRRESPAPTPSTPPVEPQVKPEPVANQATEQLPTNEPIPSSHTPLSAPISTPLTTAASDASTASEPIYDADYLQNPAPMYPSLSRKRGEYGVVMLRVHVLTDGTADQIEIFESSGFSRLDEAAIRAVKQWRFVPAKRSDETLAAWVRVPVRFDLTR